MKKWKILLREALEKLEIVLRNTIFLVLPFTSLLKEQTAFCSENSNERQSEFSLHSSAHLNMIYKIKENIRKYSSGQFSNDFWPCLIVQTMGLVIKRTRTGDVSRDMSVWRRAGVPLWNKCCCQNKNTFYGTQNFHHHLRFLLVNLWDIDTCWCTITVIWQLLLRRHCDVELHNGKKGIQAESICHRLLLIKQGPDLNELVKLRSQ